MFSKYSAWDFKRNQEKVLIDNLDYFYCIRTPDYYVEKFIIDRIKKYNSNVAWKTVLGSQLTVEWLEAQLLELNMFSQQDGHIVLNGDSISKPVKDFFLNNAKKFDNYVILLFAKSEKSFDEMSKGTGNFFVIEAPKYWEWAQYLTYLLAEMSISLPSEVKNYIVNFVSNTPDEIIRAINIAKDLDFKATDFEQLGNLIGGNRLDTFAMASLWTAKKRKVFYKKIIDGRLEVDQIRMLFNFMQKHLIKLGDISYAEKKNASPNKYDKEIIQQSAKWSADEILNDLRVFAEGEIQMKQRPKEYLEIIKKHYIREIC